MRPRSLPVVAGFTTGSALLTASSQFTSLLGLSKCAPPGGGASGCTFGAAVLDLCRRFGGIKWPVAGLSAACLALLYAVRLGPKLLGAPKRWHVISSLAPLVLVAVAVPVEWAFEKALDRAGLPPTVPIPSGLPPIALPWGRALASGTR